LWEQPNDSHWDLFNVYELRLDEWRLRMIKLFVLNLMSIYIAKVAFALFYAYSIAACAAMRRCDCL